MHLNDCKKQLRIDKIRAREALSEETRVQFSGEICRRITELPEYAAAKTIFAYKWTRGEVKLDDLEACAERDGKRMVYPLCISGTEMIAVEPGSGEDAWKASGSFGIREPDPEKGKVTDPAKIDLVICPCTAFDEEGRRLGMGGGYYDRYLPECINAAKFAVAFEVQKSDKIPADEFDIRVQAVISEAGINRVKEFI
jgi:5-formyltetrahydrofolate cyclo-ligase